MSSQPTRSSDDDQTPVADIPVTVVGGYLGSGKTTLVNHLLRTGGERMAVLVNDFGEVDIDAALIERDDGDTIALANGCICCSLVDGLATALATIAALEPPPQRLVIETSGVADPAAVAAYGHGPGLVLDAVVVLVDAETIRSRAVDKYVGDTVVAQLRSADVLVVNKADLVDEANLAAVTAWLRDQVGTEPVLAAAIEARVDPAILFGRIDQPGVARSATDLAAATDVAAGTDRHGHADEVFESWTWEGERPIGRGAVEAAMADLPDTAVRAKGILWLDDDRDRPHVLQRVGGRWSLRPGSADAVGAASPAAEPGRSRLVVIGHHGAIDDRWLGRYLG